jgi:hypothetical protein
MGTFSFGELAASREVAQKARFDIFRHFNPSSAIAQPSIHHPTARGRENPVAAKSQPKRH